MNEHDNRLRSFPPLLGEHPTRLILGSMPGADSLRLGQYYAHKRNAFWAIMGDLFNATPESDYAQRCNQVTAAGIAVWDVLSECVRPGSLDSAIVTDSIVANDFGAFFSANPLITRVFFNGAAAETIFRRQVTPQLTRIGLTEQLALTRLPSTSPANASWSYARKLAAWRAIADQAGLKPYA